MADVDLARRIELVPLDQLRAHPKNYRQHPDDQVDHLERSLSDYGAYRPVVVARDGTMLVGHGLYKTAVRMGIAELPVLRLDLDPDEPAALKLLVGDNENGKLAEVDDRLLAEHLRALADLDALLGTGYDEMMLANLVYVTRPEDEIPNLDHAAEWAGMPTFSEFESPYKVVVSLESPEERDRFLAEIGVKVINRKDRETWSVRWPPRAKEDLSSLFFDPAAEPDPAP